MLLCGRSMFACLLAALKALLSFPDTVWTSVTPSPDLIKGFYIIKRLNAVLEKHMC